MKHAFALALIAATLCGPANAVDVYKWKDSKGVVHYGDHPASGAAASTVSVPGGGGSPEEQAAAEASLEADREKLGKIDNSNPKRLRPRAQPVQKPGESACAASWRQYDAAQACFDAHRVAGGKGVTDAGATSCREMPQPSCTR